MEEIWEYKNETGRKEKLYELVDILMYVGSMLNCFSKDDYYMYLIREREITIDNSQLKKYNKIDDITDILIELRRKYPERKWHKPYNEDQINHKDRSIVTSMAAMKCFTIVIGVMLDRGYTIYEINDAISDKQDFIRNL